MYIFHSLTVFQFRATSANYLLLVCLFLSLVHLGSGSVTKTLHTDLPISAEFLYGSVEAHNYIRFSFKDNKFRHGGAAILTLRSLTGDADMYVSRRPNNHEPTFLPTNYDLHSASCGFDVIEIDNLSLPINVGVYGHPSHAKSDYIFSILFTLSDNDTLEDLKQALNGFHVYSTDQLMHFVEKLTDMDILHDKNDSESLENGGIFPILSNVFVFILKVLIESLL